MKEREKAIGPYLAPGESIQDSYHLERRSWFVTGERLIELDVGRGGSETIEVTTNDLSRASGVSVEWSQPERDIDRAAGLLAGLFGLFGVLLLLLSGSGPLETVLLVTGLLLLGVALIVGAVALDSDEGGTEIDVYLPNGGRTIELPEDGEDFGQSVTQFVGASH